MSSSELVALIVLAQQGDVWAFHQVVIVLERTLLCFVLRGLRARGVEDYAGAEEIVQDSLLRFHRHLPTWDPAIDNSGLARAFRIARHQMISFLRRRRRELGLDNLPEGGLDETPLDQLVRAGEREALEKAIATLPDEMAAILRAKFFDNRTLTSLVEERGWDYQHFYHHDYKLALQQLKRLLSGSFPEFAQARRQAHAR